MKYVIQSLLIFGLALSTQLFAFEEMPLIKPPPEPSRTDNDTHSHGNGYGITKDRESSNHTEDSGG